VKRIAFVVTYPFFLGVGLVCLWIVGQHIKKAAK
jgi:hypothetical protein